MNVLTLGSVKSTVARVLGISTSDTRVADVVNEAQQRLIHKGDWTGVFLRYVVCSNASCVVWPRQIETIEALAICATPRTLRNEWFEFLGAGSGLRDDESPLDGQVMDRGFSPTFDWIRESGKKIRVYAHSATDAGEKIVLRYYDSSAQKYYSTISGTWQEGEELTLVAPPAYAITTSEVMPHGLYGVIKDVTNKPVTLYEYDTTTLANTRTLAQYEPSEQIPSYRVSYIPGLADHGACDDAAADCANTKVTVLGRLRHIPVVVDNDPLVLGNLAAFKLMAMAIKEEESFHLGEAEALEAKALRELEHELRTHLGQGAVVQVRMAPTSLFGGGGVENLIL